MADYNSEADSAYGAGNQAESSCEISPHEGPRGLIAIRIKNITRQRGPAH